METTEKIIPAFVKALGELKNPVFDAGNPYFNSRYATLAAVRDEVTKVFAKNDLAITQNLVTKIDGSLAFISVFTTIYHRDGQKLTFEPFIVPVNISIADEKGKKANLAQNLGAASTYGRRYSLMAICGIVGDDDTDGNGIDNPKPAPDKTAPVTDKNPPEDTVAKMKKIIMAAATLDELKEVWELFPTDIKNNPDVANAKDAKKKELAQKSPSAKEEKKKPHAEDMFRNAMEPFVKAMKWTEKEFFSFMDKTIKHHDIKAVTPVQCEILQNAIEDLINAKSAGGKK